MTSNKKPQTLHSFDALPTATGIKVPNSTNDMQTPKKIITTKHILKEITPPTLATNHRPNIGWMFYKNYFKNVAFGYITNPDKAIEDKNADKIKEKNREIIEDTKWVEVKDELGNPDQSIPLKVTYPGLITGVGITHEAGVEGEFKLGLHFDYTFGQPIIHGSSVKGLLRSVFPNFKEGKDKHAAAKLKFLQDTLAEKLKNKDVKKAVKDLENEIFEGIGSDGKRIDIYHRDIFFDAIIVEPDAKQRVVERDSITPHGSNPLKNPVPLPFLKISSGCTIQFRFDVKKGSLLEASDKIMLFMEILKTLGIGAKTNVGYGQFEP